MAASTSDFSIMSGRRAAAVRAFALVCVFAAAGRPSPAAAQSSSLLFEITGEVPVLSLSELHVTNVGFGGIIDWNVTPEVALESSLAWFPRSNSSPGPLEGQGRLAGLIGGKAGRAFGRVTLFGRAHGGFLSFSSIEPVRPLPCVNGVLVPPTLECRLASHYTAVTINYGGGGSIGLDKDGRVRLRVNLSNLMVRYNFLSLGPDGQIRNGFWSNNFLFSAGVGWRF